LIRVDQISHHDFVALLGIQNLRGADASFLARIEDDPTTIETGNSDDAVNCHLFVQHMIPGDIEKHGNHTNNPGIPERHRYFCKLDRDDEEWKFRSIELPDAFIKSHKAQFHLNPVLSISNAIVAGDSVVVSEESTISINQETSPHRRLAPSTGNLNILSVYVTSTFGERPSTPVDDVKNGILGTGPTPTAYNPLNQYRSCSFGALNIQPGTMGNNVEGGVLQVQVNRRLDSSCDMSRGTCAQEVGAAADAALGRPINDYDMVIFCLPDGTINGGTSWGGFAYTGQKRAFFNGGICAIMSTVGHELGHLMGMGQ
jgi:hypothetical protein